MAGLVRLAGSKITTISLVLLSLLLVEFVLLSMISKENAVSAELMKHSKRYHTLYKASKYREAEPHAIRALELGKREFSLELVHLNT
ncbi:MAG: hypothetical protein GY927_13810 [bacterium]|nr:hypothetical protein [bacterium]